MNVATIYTLYGRRAGAELCFEKTLRAMAQLDPGVRFAVLCNRQSLPVLESLALPSVRPVPVPALDNQFRKAFWLEFRSAAFFRPAPPDVFWNPSGCNHFPGKWPFPAVTTFHDLGEYHVRGKYDIKRTVFRKLLCIPRSVRRSAAFTAVSRFTAGDMQRILRVPDVHVVLNGPSPHAFSPVPDAPQAVARALSLPAPPPRFWFVPGRTDYVGKGLDLALSAFSSLSAAGVDPGLLLFAGPPGDGHPAFLKRLAALDPSQSRLRYLGRVPDSLLFALYQSCFAVLLPSRFEGFGFPVLEAMDAGAPVVCSDAGSLPEVAGDGALLFPAGDASALADRMRSLLADPALRARFAAAGHARSSLFSWTECGRQMLGVLRMAASRHSPPSPPPTAVPGGS